MCIDGVSLKKTRAVDLGRRFKLGLCSTRDVQEVEAATINALSKSAMCYVQFRKLLMPHVYRLPGERIKQREAITQLTPVIAAWEVAYTMTLTSLKGRAEQ